MTLTDDLARTASRWRECAAVLRRRADRASRQSEAPDNDRDDAAYFDGRADALMEAAALVGSLAESEPKPLTIADAVRLSTVVEWAIHSRRLIWLDARGDVARGTARSIGDERGNLAGRTDDVRDCHLRITTDAGWEWFVPVAEALAMNERGEMVADFG